jgi:hypothetical protein
MALRKGWDHFRMAITSDPCYPTVRGVVSGFCCVISSVLERSTHAFLHTQALEHYPGHTDHPLPSAWELSSSTNVAHYDHARKRA